MSANGAPVDSGMVTLAMELGAQTQLLHALLAESRSDLLEIAVADVQQRELVLDQFPVPGSKRAIVFRTGNGTDNLAVPTTGVLVLPDNASRLGGTIVNSATNPVILYLCATGKATPGVPAIWLAANGGSWDFRLGNVIWGGSVSAVAQIGASTITVAEV